MNTSNIFHTIFVRSVQGYWPHVPEATISETQERAFVGPSKNTGKKKKKNQKGNCKFLCVTYKCKNLDVKQSWYH